MADIKKFKVVIAGDDGIGKRHLFHTYTNKSFPGEYVPHVCDYYTHHITVDGIQHVMLLICISGQEHYERVRILSYAETDCFVLCYSINSRSSLENILLKWYPEIKKYSPSASIILVGMKKDLRESTGKNDFIAYDKGNALRRKIGASSFIECSALKQEGVDLIFEEAIRAVIKETSAKKKTCILS